MHCSGQVERMLPGQSAQVFCDVATLFRLSQVTLVPGTLLLKRVKGRGLLLEFIIAWYNRNSSAPQLRAFRDYFRNSRGFAA